MRPSVSFSPTLRSFIRKTTRSTRCQRSPFIRVETSVEGTATIRLRHANWLPWLSRQRNTFSANVPTTTTGMSPIRIVCPTISPVGKNVDAASAPRSATA